MDSFTLDASDLDIADLTAADYDDEDSGPAQPPPPAPVATIPISGARYVSRTGADISRALFFDFETAPHPERSKLAQGVEEVGQRPAVDPATLISGTVADLMSVIKDANPPGDYLEEVLVAERASKKPRSSVIGDIQKIIAGRAKAAESFRKSLSLNPCYNRIVAMGWAVGGSEPEGMLAENEDQERELLRAFWDLVGACTPNIGFNHTLFDLPVACVRSVLLGVEPSRMFDLPRDRGCLDLCQKLGVTGQRPRLKEIARLMGVPIPEEGVDGSMVAELIESDPGKVLRYVKSDVEVLRGMFWKFSGYLWI